jgi:hypothetical protein
MFDGDYSWTKRCQRMVEETVWVDKKCVGPRLGPDELLLMYRLVDNQYWLLRRHSHPLWNFGDVSRLRRKLLRTLNPVGTSK